MALTIKAVLDGDGTGFFRMMGRAEGVAAKFGSRISSIIAGAFSVGAIANLTKETIEFASRMRDLADQLNVNVEWLQKMQGVLKQNGGDAEQLAKFINELTKSRAQALGGDKASQGAFQKFGFSNDDIAHMPIQQMITQIAAAFEKGNQQELIPAFANLGSRGSKELIASFTKNLNKQLEEISGNIIPEDLIDQLDDLGDALDRLKQKAVATAAPSIGGAADFLSNLLDAAKVGSDAIAAMLHDAFTEAGTQTGETPFEAFINALMESAEKTVVENAAAADARRVARTARHNREKAPLNIEPLAVPAANKTKASRATDALASVGNFLGGGTGDALSRTMERTNQILVESKNIQTQTLNTMNRLLALNIDLGGLA